MRSKKPLCFVIMGFGKKTDPSSGRTLDLDKTYKNIIKPSVLENGYECIRADEILDSGIIDKSMYILLMQSELVIADISTYNPNAIYELGVRHAVKPFSTIILKEKEGKIPFDIDHTRILTYSHLGEDIGVDEAERCKNHLKDLISSISRTKSIDSPMYEYINNVNPPVLPEEEYFQLIDELAEKEKHIFAISEKAKSAMEKSSFDEAEKFWAKANELIDNEPFFIQQRALSRYKSKSPSPQMALIDALKIIEELDPNGPTNDPETLGITGAIYKQLWIETKDKNTLDRAIDLYGKCYKIRNDYYTGENYALCLSLKASNEENSDEKIYSKIAAKKVRESIIEYLEDIIKIDGISGREDEKWIYATLAHCYLALGDQTSYSKFEKSFQDCKPLQWEIDTFRANEKLLLEVKEK